MPVRASKPPVLLTKWYLKRIGSDPSGLILIGVEGWRSDSKTSRPWHSTTIKERLDSRNVVTASGSVYRLVGEMDESTCAAAGFAPNTIAAFREGFPDDWEMFRAAAMLPPKLPAKSTAPPPNERLPRAAQQSNVIHESAAKGPLANSTFITSSKVAQSSSMLQSEQAVASELHISSCEAGFSTGASFEVSQAEPSTEEEEGEETFETLALSKRRRVSQVRSAKLSAKSQAKSSPKAKPVASLKGKDSPTAEKVHSPAKPKSKPAAKVSSPAEPSRKPAGNINSPGKPSSRSAGKVDPPAIPPSKTMPKASFPTKPQSKPASKVANSLPRKEGKSAEVKRSVGKQRRARSSIRKAQMNDSSRRRSSEGSISDGKLEEVVSVRRSSSGRVSIRPLAWWTNEQIRRTSDGGYAGIEQGELALERSSIDFTASFASDRTAKVAHSTVDSSRRKKTNVNLVKTAPESATGRKRGRPRISNGATTRGLAIDASESKAIMPDAEAIEIGEYVAEEDERVDQIASKLGISADKVVRMNVERWGKIRTSSRLRAGTQLLVPMDCLGRLGKTTAISCDTHSTYTPSSSANTGKMQVMTKAPKTAVKPTAPRKKNLSANNKISRCQSDSQCTVLSSQPAVAADSVAESAPLNGQRGSVWTEEDRRELRRVHFLVPPTSQQFWEQVSQAMGGRKNADECSAEYFRLNPSPTRGRRRATQSSSAQSPLRPSGFVDASPWRKGQHDSSDEDGMLKEISTKDREQFGVYAQKVRAKRLKKKDSAAAVARRAKKRAVKSNVDSQVQGIAVAVDDATDDEVDVDEEESDAEDEYFE